MRFRKYGILFGILFLIGVLGCEPRPEQSQQPNRPPLAEPDAVRIIATDQGYGYEVWHNGKRVILQRHIPAVQGNLPFPDSLLARETGELCAEKIRQGMFPPSLTLAEVETIFARSGKRLPTVR